VLEEMIHDLRLLWLRHSKERASEPKAAILDSGTLRSTPESGHRGGYELGHKGKKGLKVHAAVERDFAWASRLGRLVKDYERLPETVAGLHFVAFVCLFLQQATRHTCHGIITASSLCGSCSCPPSARGTWW
jgi:hypothetical protein